MKFRTGLILGLAAGFAVASWANRREDDLYTGPDEESSTNPAARLLSGQARRLVRRAGARSYDAIQRARQQIQGRLGDTSDASWN